MKHAVRSIVSAAFGLVILVNGAPSAELTLVKRIVIFFQENQSFDGYFGLFPGANGFRNSNLVQVDKNGVPYTTLPQPRTGGVPDVRFPSTLPNQPFDVAPYVGPNGTTGDLVHKFYQQQYQINQGRNDKFVAFSDAAGLAFSYFDVSDMPLGQLAKNFTLGDNMFHGAFGGSFLNHMWLISCAAPVFPNAPRSKIINASALPGPYAWNSTLYTDGYVTGDGYVVNTAYSINSPHPANQPTENLVPRQNATTIGDLMSAAGVSWAWYSGGWNNAINGTPDPLFQFHHQPFAYFTNYSDGPPGRAAHLKDETDFAAAIASNTLPQVSFVKMLGEDNEHPGYASILRGQQRVANYVQQIQNSPAWNDVLIVITYDENGGRWDHVSPPVVDKWGPGTRVPLVIISPFAKRGFVDHTQYEHASVLKTIENLFGLPSLSTRDAVASDFTPALQPVPVTSTTGTASATTDDTEARNAEHTGLVAGVIIVGVAVLIAAAVLVFVVVRYRRRSFAGTELGLVTSKRHMKAVADRPAATWGELALRAGDVVEILSEEGDSYTARLNGTTGTVPTFALQPLPSAGNPLFRDGAVSL